MFQFRGFPSYTYVFSIWCRISIPAGFPIRKSAGLWIFAPNRSLSQLVTSFFGSWCQVILPTLLLAWPLLTNVLNFPLPIRHLGSSNYIRIRDIVLLDFVFLKLKFPFSEKPWFFSSWVWYVFTYPSFSSLYHHCICSVFKVQTIAFAIFSNKSSLQLSL